MQLPPSSNDTSTEDGLRLLERSLRKVKSRMECRSLVQRTGQIFMISGLVYGLALLVSRYTGWIPSWFRWESVMGLILFSIALGAILRRRVTLEDAAEQVDDSHATKDLFLTAKTLRENPDNFGRIVGEQASQRAREIKPDRAAPWDLSRPLVRSTLLTGALLLATGFIPQRVADQQQNEAVKALAKQIEETRKETELKIEKKKDETPKDTEETKRKLDELMETFKRQKPDKPEENLKDLQDQRKELNQAWKSLREETLSDALSKKKIDQEFGARSADWEKWEQELSDGKMDALQEAVKQLKQQAEEAASIKDPAERERAMKKLSQDIQEMQQFAENAMKSDALRNALSQCKNMANAAQSGELSKEAMDALQQAMQLSEMEMQSLAEQMQNMQDLESAMEAVSKAMQCNKPGSGQGLDGNQCQTFTSMEQYKEWLNSLEAAASSQKPGQSKGQGTGMKGPGTGEGGLAPEDPDALTDFTPEKSPTGVSAGQVLMEWKVTDKAPTGQAKYDYARRVRQVKQEAQEAIVTENVPAGYHDAIQRYFDQLDEPRIDETP